MRRPEPRRNRAARAGACQVEIAYRWFGAERQCVETVEIHVERSETTPAENCAEAEALAVAVNDRLPPPD